MIIERQPILLECLSGNIAYIAQILLIISQFTIAFSQRCKCIQHNTRDDVAEQNLEEDEVDHVIAIAHNLEALTIAYRTRHEKFHDAVHHTLAHLLSISFSIIDILLVITESNRTEHKSKHHTHETHISQFFDIDTDSLENITNLRNVAENIHQMQKE